MSHTELIYKKMLAQPVGSGKMFTAHGDNDDYAGLIWERYDGHQSWQDLPVMVANREGKILARCADFTHATEVLEEHYRDRQRQKENGRSR